MLLVPSATAASSRRPAVPLRVQHAIGKRVGPLYAYVPTRVPAGFRYRWWDSGTSTDSPPTGIRLNIWFSTIAAYAGADLGFQVSPASAEHGLCAHLHHLGSYRLAGVDVWWTLADGTVAWRCVKQDGRVIKLSARGWGRADWGDAALTPAVRRHTRALARMLISVRRLG
jgi:hypothetical protein